MQGKKVSPDQHLIIHLYDHFEWKGHYCLVLERLNMNLYEFVKKRQHQGLKYFPISKKQIKLKK